MSHAYGAVRFNRDGAVYFFEYNGSADVAQPALRATVSEVREHWRQGEWTRCQCGRDPEAVEIHADYGHGFSWEGTACRECRCIVDPLAPPWESTTDGKPDWLTWPEE